VSSVSAETSAPIEILPFSLFPFFADTLGYLSA